MAPAPRATRCALNTRPLPPPGTTPSPNGIIAFAFQPSDDGKLALVEFVAINRDAFKDLLADTSIKVFVKGQHKRQDIEAEFKKYKKDFSLSSFTVVVP